MAGNEVDVHEMMNLSSDDKEDHEHETVNKNTEITDKYVGSDECSIKSFPIADNETVIENTEIPDNYVETDKNALSRIHVLPAHNESTNTCKKKVCIIIFMTLVVVIAGVAVPVAVSLTSKPQDPGAEGTSMSRNDHTTQPTDPGAEGTSMSRHDYTTQPADPETNGTSMSKHDNTTQPTNQGADGTSMSKHDYTTQPADPGTNGTSMSKNGDEGFYNIVRMVNTPETVEWAVGQGANGVEIDMAFDNESGNALFFRNSAEGEVCDCTCVCVKLLWLFCKRDNVCEKHLSDDINISPCQAQTSYSTLLSTIATKSSIALVIIDSKIETGSMTDDVMRNAGRSIITALTTHLFGGGYGGKVIVGSPTLDTLPYLQSAVNAIKGSPYEARVYFTIDFEKDNIVNTLTILHTLPTMNIVYGTGISACTPQQIEPSTMKLAAVNKAKGVTGLTYLWTLDSNLTIVENVRYVHGVITHYPGQLNDILKEKGIKKATQSSTIPQATNGKVITSTASLTCACKYHPGGCYISRAAHQDMACHCEYKGNWTCGGSVSQCLDTNSYYCKNPDTSVNSCLLGYGDCEGYKNATCDCNYHPGGCLISHVPPRNTACRCVYKGNWTCGGEISRCRNETSQYCENPDSSVNTCIQGGGDCEGYQTAKCDCDYHPGGCSISAAAPKNTACKCVYKGASTCGGEIVKCSDFDSQYCLNPDKSIQSCFEGRGDCEGYNNTTEVATVTTVGMGV